MDANDLRKYNRMIGSSRPTRTYIGARIAEKGGKLVVVGHALDFFRRWMNVNPMWESEYTEILHCTNRDGWHCPITGASIYVTRQGFMLRIEIMGYGDNSDAWRTARILSGQAGTD